MSADLAIVACGGNLPVELAAAAPRAICFSLTGIPHLLGDLPHEHRIEKLGALFAHMKALGCRRVVLAGGLARPALDPIHMDEETKALAPRIMRALQHGDDGLLREVISMFEEQGFEVIGAHMILPDLVADSDLSVGRQMDPQNQTDAVRAIDILAALSPLDIGQGCVVASGQCLGIETVQGTDALLSFVAQTRLAALPGGVFVKRAKLGQDLRVDMPVIGPETIRAAAEAGLDGIVIEAGKVMILERNATLDNVEAAGLFLTAREL